MKLLMCFAVLLLSFNFFIASTEITIGQQRKVLGQLKKFEQAERDRNLMKAVELSSSDRVESLLSKGADANALLGSSVSNLKATPFLRALTKNNSKIIKLLKEHGGTLVPIFPKSYDFTKVYDTCKLLNFNERFIFDLYTLLFSSKKDIDGRSWLHSLALDKRHNNDDYKAIWQKLVAGCLKDLTKEDHEARDIFGNPHLYYIKVSGNSYLQKMVNKDSCNKTVENLLGDTADQVTRNVKPFGYHKPNINVEVSEIDMQSLENFDQIVQMFPDNFNFFDVEKVLRAVSYNVDDAFTILHHIFPNFNQQDRRGNTLLHHIVFISSHNYVCNNLSELLKKLIENGVEPNKTNSSGCTPLHIATFKNKECLVRELLAGGADPLIRLSDGRRARDLTFVSSLKTTLAYSILSRRSKYIAEVLDSRKNQRIPRALGKLIAEFEMQEVNEKTGNIKISYDN